MLSAHHGRPDIFNTDQWASQFTGPPPSPARSPTTAITISMDGKGAWRDNVCCRAALASQRQMGLGSLSVRAFTTASSEARTSIGPAFEP